MNDKKILITGGLGQIGTELYSTIKQRFPKSDILITDIKPKAPEIIAPEDYQILDITDEAAVNAVFANQKFDYVFHMVAILSATAEKFPLKSWDINLRPLLQLLEFSREGKIGTLFFPSSIAVYGQGIDLEKVDDSSPTIPLTSYGIAKIAGEYWCNYYYYKFGVDVRSLRFPGIVSWKTQPGGGTTDYAVEMFHAALNSNTYECFLAADRTLPMMYMDDALNATMQLSMAKSESIRLRTSYNIFSLSFSPKDLEETIRKHIPDFKTVYKPDHRDAYAANWPKQIEDIEAQMDWGWKPGYDLNRLVEQMFLGLS